MSETGWEAVTRLERAVAEASARLRALRAENEELRERLEAIEGERRAEVEERSSHRDAWQAERLEVTDRVERLAAGLETLLADLSPDG
jgi:hypothetical protein